LNTVVARAKDVLPNKPHAGLRKGRKMLLPSDLDL